MKKLHWIFPALAMALAGPALAHGAAGPAGTSEVRFREAMRKLWEDHVTYTAFFYTAVVHGGDDAGVLAKRLLRNQDDIGDAVTPFYGEEAGKRLSALLRDHILIAADLVKAAKAGDAAAQQRAADRWNQNAADVAAFLASANPHWSRSELAEMLHAHLALTTDAVVAKLHGDTARAIEAYDRGHEHMLAFSDLLASGIAKQFPDRFAKVAVSAAPRRATAGGGGR